MKISDLLAIWMEDGRITELRRIAELLDWDGAAYDEAVGFVTVPIRNGSLDKYYEVMETMAERFQTDPDRITKEDISLTISTVSGALRLIVDAGIAFKESGCAELTDGGLTK